MSKRHPERARRRVGEVRVESRQDMVRNLQRPHFAAGGVESHGAGDFQQAARLPDDPEGSFHE